MYILFRLRKQPVMRYVKIEKAPGSVTLKTLSDKLREPESGGLFQHKHPQVPPKAEYSSSEVCNKAL